MRASRPLAAASFAVVALALAGCGDSRQPAPAPADEGAGPGRTGVGAGVSARYPRGWQLIAARISAVTYPVERLLLTSYRTRRGGDCSPERAELDLPDDGALIYLFEYRPQRGAVWQKMRRRDFPPRPRRFALRRRDLGGFECWRVPSYLIRFRAADRPFQLHVALGRRATARRRAQVLRILDSLRFSTLPPPPRDPYARWRLLTTETGDSIRTPPRWTAGATTGPRRYRRPRALFFAASRTLRGLGAAVPRRARRARRLPAPFPAQALDAFAVDGVLLWVREDAKGPASSGFPALPRRAWPQAADFRPVRGGAARRWPRLRWERAAAARRGNRFSVWIVSGAGASEADRALARKAAAALALSTGSFRDAPCRRSCRSG